MTTAPTHVDGLLADDLEIFTDILSKHGRGATLQDDIESLVEARFTAELLSDYDKHFGNSPDFTPKSLIRLNQDGITPDLAGAGLTRGHLTANDAIADFKPFLSEGLRKGLDARQVSKAYTSGLTSEALERHTLESILDALALHENTGGNTSELLALRQLLPVQEYPAADVVEFLKQVSGGADSPTLLQVIAALEPHAQQLKMSQTQTLMLICDPEVREVSQQHKVPFPRLVSLGMAKAMVNTDSIKRAIEVAGGLPDEDNLGVIVRLSEILGGATHQVSVHKELRTPLWLDGPAVPYPPLDEALRRYRSLENLDPANKLRVLPLIGTPGAVAAFEALRAHGGGPHLTYSLDDLARAASLVSDYSPETAELSATFTSSVLANVDPEVAEKAKMGTLRGRSARDLLGVLLQYVARNGAWATAHHLKTLSDRSPLLQDQVIFALVGAQEENVTVEQLCEFLDSCPQVSPQVVAHLVARSVNPVLYQAIMRAAPFESAAIHIQLYNAITEAGISVDDAIVRLRQATDGNPLAPRSGLLAAACGHSELLNGPWGGADLTQALLNSDPERRELEPADSSLPHGPSLAWPRPSAIPLGVGVPQWTLQRAASAPWTLNTSTPAHQAASENIEQWRRALFPDQPSATLDRAPTWQLEKSAYDYALNIDTARKATAPKAENDLRWDELHRVMLEQELAKEKPDFRIVQSLIRPDLDTTYGLKVWSREDAELLSAFTLLYPELSADQATKLVETANKITAVLSSGPARLRSVEHVHGPLTDYFEDTELPKGTRFDAKYIYDFAGAYPNAGAVRLLINFLTGQSPDQMPKKLQRIDRKPEAIDWFLRTVVLRSDTGNRFLLSESLGTYLGLPKPGPLERRNQEVTKRAVSASLLEVLAPEGTQAVVTLSGAETRETPERVAAHPEDSVGAYSKRISTVVDWYAGILIDPLWVSENAPALIDRRSEAFAPIESVLVRLQDHPLMRGSLDVSTLDAIGNQVAPPDFVELTYQLELAMKTAWDKAVSEGTSYTPNRDTPNVAAKLKADKALLEAITLEVEIGELQEKAEKLTSFSPETEEGQISHAKAKELLQRAAELAVERDAAAAQAQAFADEAERLARDTDSIEKLFQTLSKAPLLSVGPGVGGLPALAAFAQRADRELSSPSRVRVNTAVRSEEKTSVHLIR